jgi:hypothetical protein
MATTKKTAATKKKKQPKVVLIRLPGKGKIDPKLIRKAVLKVHRKMLEDEAAAKAKGKSEANGDTHVVEAG